MKKEKKRKKRKREEQNFRQIKVLAGGAKLICKSWINLCAMHNWGWQEVVVNVKIRRVLCCAAFKHVRIQEAGWQAGKQADTDTKWKSFLCSRLKAFRENLIASFLFHKLFIVYLNFLHSYCVSFSSYSGSELLQITVKRGKIS